MLSDNMIDDDPLFVPRKPEDFDFPCSPDWRAAYDQSCGLDPMPYCSKTLSEARFDDDLEEVRRFRREFEERQLQDTPFHTARHSALWKAYRKLELEFENLLRRFEFKVWEKRPKKTKKPVEDKQPQRQKVSL